MNCTELTNAILNIKTQISEFDSAISGQNSGEAMSIKKQIEIELDKHKLEIAKHILGKDFLGPEEIKAVFGLESIEVPPIPFSIADLRRAKELGQFLILRTDQIPPDKLELTHTRGTLERAPKTRWALVTKELIPDSTNKTYLEQTEQIIKYLEEEVFAGRELPPEYVSAIVKFNAQKEELGKLSESSDIGEKLSSLDITNLIRQNFDELLYDLEVYRAVTGQYLLYGDITWTSSYSASNGSMVGVSFGSGGVVVDFSSPSYFGPDIGAVFSRSQ